MGRHAHMQTATASACEESVRSLFWFWASPDNLHGVMFLFSVLDFILLASCFGLWWSGIDSVVWCTKVQRRFKKKRALWTLKYISDQTSTIVCCSCFNLNIWFPEQNPWTMGCFPSISYLVPLCWEFSASVSNMKLGCGGKRFGTVALSDSHTQEHIPVWTSAKSVLT